MAMFPCTVGLHRYQGPQQSAYLGAVNGGRSERVKQRLCPEHLVELVNWADEHLDEIDIMAPPSAGDLTRDRKCFDCADTTTSWALFCNIYALKQEPRVWYGSSCLNCVNGFLNHMGLTP